eukprot:scaffold108850_cov16-Prasinocladus_malaysianus.AAC.1
MEIPDSLTYDLMMAFKFDSRMSAYTKRLGILMMPGPVVGLDAAQVWTTLRVGSWVVSSTCEDLGSRVYMSSAGALRLNPRLLGILEIVCSGSISLKPYLTYDILLLTSWNEHHKLHYSDQQASVKLPRQCDKQNTGSDR